MFSQDFPKYDVNGSVFTIPSEIKINLLKHW